MTRFSLGTVFTVGCLFLVGCDQIGPGSIELGRTNYNDAIHKTAAVQVLANIVRVHDQEMPLVMDVTEVDAALVAETSLTGGITGIAARAMTAGGTLIGSGSVTSSVIYEESPTIRYQPLSGQPLIAQLSTPIDVGSIAYLSDSDWPLTSILTFAVNYATLGYKDKYYALNAMFELDSLGALALAATKSPLTTTAAGAPDGGTKPPQKTDATQNTAASPNDSLTLYIEPKHPDVDLKDARSTQTKITRLWSRLQRLYGGTQPAGVTKAIELRTAPIASPSVAKGCGTKPCEEIAPLMRTSSALGVLKNATDRTDPFIELVTPAAFDRIRSETANKGAIWQGIPDFYTLAPSDQDSVCLAQSESTKARAEDAGDCPLEQAAASEKPPRAKGTEDIDDAVGSYVGCYVTHYPEPGNDGLYVFPERYPANICTDEGARLEADRKTACAGDADCPAYLLDAALAHLRRYILIIESPNAPAVDFPQERTFAIYSRNGKYYYVLDDDEISKKNLALIAEFMSIMAIPSQGQGLTSSISVNAK